ncbi:uncharacterized protein [Littorina saxatilis]|uniref:uncharacterized protein n=1 Tax=Littorina saxatilis TaxID=31220 RepID=UPI0038B47842
MSAASSEHSEEVSSQTTCDLVTSTTPGTENTTTSSPQYSVTGGTTSGKNIPELPKYCYEFTTEKSSADGGSGKNVAVIVGALVAAVAVVVVFVIIFIVYRRKFKERRGSGSDGARQLAVYENQGFHGQPVGTLVDDSSVVNAREMSDHGDPSRASDASNEYLTPMNVYDGLGNRNIEENPYNALANQNSTYEGLSSNRNENQIYESLVASGGQSEDYEIPDTTGLNKETEVNRDSDEYYNQASSKMTGNSSLSQDVPSSEVSEYQSG